MRWVDISAYGARLIARKHRHEGVYHFVVQPNGKGQKLDDELVETLNKTGFLQLPRRRMTYHASITRERAMALMGLPDANAIDVEPESVGYDEASGSKPSAAKGDDGGRQTATDAREERVRPVGEGALGGVLPGADEGTGESGASERRAGDGANPDAQGGEGTGAADRSGDPEPTGAVDGESSVHGSATGQADGKSASGDGYRPADGISAPDGGRSDVGARPDVTGQSVRDESDGELTEPESQQDVDGGAQRPAPQNNEQPVSDAARAPEGPRNPNHFSLAGNLDRVEGGEERKTFSPKHRLAQNVAAIDLLRTLESEQRAPNEDEKITLARYNGWGGLDSVFNLLGDEEHQEELLKRYEQQENPAAFGLPESFEDYGLHSPRTPSKETVKLIAHLQNVLSEEEISNIRASVNNSHYTAPEVTESIWKAIESLGLESREGEPLRVLEPSMGIGTFLGMAPKSVVERAEFHGTEIEPFAGKIAKHLYPDSDLRIQGFEKLRTPANWFDVSISNVPFGKYRVYDRAYNNYKLPVHDYFIVRSLDMTRPGGVCAMITSSHTMDKSTERARRLMYERAELAGVVRLPDNAQKRQANTSVVTDVLVFVRRHEPAPAIEDNPNANWVRTGFSNAPEAQSILRHAEHVDDKELKRSLILKVPKVNHYFESNPKQDTFVGLAKGEQPQALSNQFVTPIIGVRATRPIASLSDEITQRLVGQFKARQQAGLLPDTNPPVLNNDDDIGAETAQDRKNGQSVRSQETFDVRGEGSLTVHPETDEIIVIEAVEEDEEGEKHTVYSPVEGLGKKPEERLRGMIALRDAMNEVFRAQIDHPEDEVLFEKSRLKLNELYDEFIAKNGPINKSANAKLIEHDPESGRLFALEIYDEEEKTAKKAQVFHERVIRDPEPITSANNVSDALAVTLAERGKVNLRAIADLWGKDEQKTRQALLEEQLVFEDPDSDELVPASKYLSGDVVGKLESARLAEELTPGRFGKNIKALESVQPEPIPPHDIKVAIGSEWLPREYLEGFIFHLMPDLAGLVPNDKKKSLKNLPSPIDIHYNEYMGSWTVNAPMMFKSRVDAKNDYGTSRRNFFNLLDLLMNKKPTDVYDTVKDDEGKTRQVYNEDESRLAEEKAAFILEKWDEYLWQLDPSRGQAIADEYNLRFNRFAAPKYDGSHLTFPGMNAAISLRPTQANAVWRAVMDGRFVAAHEVGTGKTFTAVAATQEWKRLGMVNKPAMAVPNHLVSQIEREARQLYPKAKIYAASTNDLQTGKRGRFLGKVANNDWDLVILPHSLFDRISVPENYEKEMLAHELAEAREALSSLESDDAPRYSVKGIERLIKMFETRLAEIEEKSNARGREAGIDMDELGFDAVIADEFHRYKNCPVLAAGSSEIVDSIQGSSRARDFLMKLNWLADKRGAHEGIGLLSGTPISNNLLELYNVQRYIQPDTLRDIGLYNINQWANAFMESYSQWEPAPSGDGFKRRVRQKLINVPEVMAIFRQDVDVVTAEDANIKRPEKKTVQVVAEKDDAQQHIMDDLAYRAERMADGERIDPKKDNLLKIVSEGRKCSIDPRLISSDYDYTESVRIHDFCKKFLEEYKRTEKEKGTQALFCDIGTPKKNGTFSLYAEIKRALIEDYNVPEGEIAFIHDYPKDSDRSKLFSKMNKGEKRLIIGSTAKLGEGSNIQERLCAIHHFDLPWRPSDVEQRDGRGQRYGNIFSEIRRYMYLTEGTLDPFLSSILDRKARQFSQLLRGESKERVFDDSVEPTFSEAMAATTPDERVRRKIELTDDLRRLESLARSHSQQQSLIAQSIQNTEKVLERNLATRNEIASVPDPIGQVDHGKSWVLTFNDGDGKPRKVEGDAEHVAPTVRKCVMRGNQLSLTDVQLKVHGIPVECSKEYVSGTSISRPGYKVFYRVNQFETHSPARLDETIEGKDAILASLDADVAKNRDRLSDLEARYGESFEKADELAEVREKLKKLEQIIEKGGSIDELEEPITEDEQDAVEQPELIGEEPEEDEDEPYARPGAG